MPNPEVISVGYQDILARTLTRPSGGFRHDINVTPELKEQFLETLTLPTERFPIAHVFFMVQSIVMLQHTPEILLPGSWRDIAGDQTEVVEGHRIENSESFVATDSTAEGTLFRPLSELVLESELPEYTVRNVLEYTANGSYRDNVSRPLMEIIGQRARVNIAADAS